MQDVFYQLIQTVENAINPIEQLATWLYRIIRNIIINKSKKKHEEELPAFDYDEEGNILNDFSEVLYNDNNPTPETEYLHLWVWE